MRAPKWMPTMMSVAAMVLAGCGTGETPTGAPPDDETEVSTLRAPAAEPMPDPTVGPTVGPTTGRVHAADDVGHATPEPADAATAQSTPAPPATGSMQRTVTFTTADGLPGDRVGRVDVGVDGTVWVAIEGEPVDGADWLRYERYARFDADGWIDVGSPDPSELGADATSHGVYGMQVTGGPHGSVWVVTTGFDSIGDAYRFDGERWTSPSSGRMFVTGESAPDGSLWTLGIDVESTTGPGVYRLDGDTLTPQPAPDGGIECVFCVDYEVDAAGALWMYANGAIQRFDGESWTAVRRDAPLLAGTHADESRWQLGVDGNHWIVGRSSDGTSPWAVARLGPDGIARMPLGDDGVDTWAIQNAVRGVTGDANGTLWLAVDGLGVYRIDVDARTVTQYALETLPSLELNDLDAAPDGSVWVATNAGITRIALAA